MVKNAKSAWKLMLRWRSLLVTMACASSARVPSAACRYVGAHLLFRLLVDIVGILGSQGKDVTEIYSVFCWTAEELGATE